MLHALCSVLRAPCSVLRAPRSMLHAPCSMLYAPCSMLRAPCSMLYALCSMLYAPCSVLHAHHVSFLLTEDTLPILSAVQHQYQRKTMKNRFDKQSGSAWRQSGGQAVMGYLYCGRRRFWLSWSELNRLNRQWKWWWVCRTCFVCTSEMCSIAYHTDQTVWWLWWLSDISAGQLIHPLRSPDEVDSAASQGHDLYRLTSGDYWPGEQASRHYAHSSYDHCKRFGTCVITQYDVDDCVIIYGSA